MMSTSLSTRFALRQESFGGLLLDYCSNSFQILGPNEYQSLLAWGRFGELPRDASLPANSLNAHGKMEGIDAFQYIGTCNIRLISPPEVLPTNCLSGPIKVYDTYTRRCNLNCEHCYSSSNKQLKEVRRTPEQTATIMRKFYETGVMEWQFTGGEPTIIPDLFESIKIAKGFGMTVTLNTNGCWSGRVGNKLIESGVDGMIVSVEGAEATNDRRRGTGSYKRVMRSLKQLALLNVASPNQPIDVTINMTIGRDNIAEVEHVVQLAACSGFNINFVPLKVTGRAPIGMKDAMLSTAEYMAFAQQVQEIRANPASESTHVRIGLKHKDLYCMNYPDKSKLPCPLDSSECQALTVAVGLLPDGHVFACPFLMDHSEFIGPSMLTSSVYEAWGHSSLRRFREAAKLDCLDCCFYKERCRGKCRASVLLDGGRICSGNLVGEDRYCFKRLLATEGRPE